MPGTVWTGFRRAIDCVMGIHLALCRLASGELLIYDGHTPGTVWTGFRSATDYAIGICLALGGMASGDLLIV